MQFSYMRQFQEAPTACFIFRQSAHELVLRSLVIQFDKLHRNARYLLDVRPAGRWPAECFYYAGGVPAIMEEIKEHLHLDVMTVTGKTVGENIKDCVNKNPDVIRPIDNPIHQTGGIAILKGNLAPDSGVVKRSAVAPEMLKHEGPARVFDCEEDAIAAIKAAGSLTVMLL